MPGTVLSDLYVWDLIASLLCKVVLFLSPLYRDTLKHGKGRWCPVGDVPEPVDGVVLESEAWSVCPATTLMDTRQESSVKTRDHWPEPSLNAVTCAPASVALSALPLPWLLVSRPSSRLGFRSAEAACDSSESSATAPQTVSEPQVC